MSALASRRSALPRRLLAAGLYVAMLAWGVTALANTSGHRSISVLCSSIEDLCRSWADGFTRQSGIDVVMVRLSTGEALARLSRPEGRREFDVWHGGPADAYVTAAERGLLAAYHSPEAGAVAPRYKDSEGRWTGVYVGVLGFCSNQLVLDRLGLAAPTSWDDLLAPELRHQVSVPNPLSSGTGYTMVWTQRARLGTDARALDYLKRLDANVLQYTNSGLAPAGIVARGEAAVSVTFSQHCLRAIDQGTSQLVVTYPREGTGFEIGSVAVLADARDPEAARRYVDYAISAEGQLTGAGAWAAQLPTRSGIDPDPRLGARADILDYTPQDAAAARQRLTDLVSSELR
ncbi:MAG: ABC transporter substrate-binding protein [Actinobacteria bacterium]|nr:ABC transporter substrate-binding protein [Actinomycetota bacterium]